MRVRFGLQGSGARRLGRRELAPSRAEGRRRASVPNPAGPARAVRIVGAVQGRATAGRLRGPGLVPANTKLWLWSKTPFDFITHGGGEYADWMVDEHRGLSLPVAARGPRAVPRLRARSRWQRSSSRRGFGRRAADRDQLARRPAQHLVELDESIDGLSKALEIVLGSSRTRSSSNAPTASGSGCPTPAKSITVTAVAASGVTAFARQQDGGTVGPVIGGLPDSRSSRSRGDRLIELELLDTVGDPHRPRLFVVGASRKDLDAPRDDQRITCRTRWLHWSEAGNILQPHTHYRLEDA